MISFDEARSRLLAGVCPLASERVALADGFGRVLAADLVARTPLPRFDHSAMDGYAVRVGGFAGEGPWTLCVAGESAAGGESPALLPGTACRIFTGALIPAGADAVVMQEQVVRTGEVIELASCPKRGAHIRRAGEDLAAGEVALVRGCRLGAGALAVAAMLDTSELTVSRAPVVTVVCTGDELRPVGSFGGNPAAIAESNSVAIAALARQAGARVRIAPIAKDDPETLADALTQALVGTDLLVTVGGVSVGDHDVVRPALERAGVTLDFWRVAMKPGKPLAVGRSANAHVLGLPGNPAGAMVTFALFGMPLLRALQGDRAPFPLRSQARLLGSQRRSVDRVEFVRVQVVVEADGWSVRVASNQSSGAATSLAGSDGVARLSPGEGVLSGGSWVEVVRWSDL
jgi:molybdopterin molybdotransferase